MRLQYCRRTLKKQEKCIYELKAGVQTNVSLKFWILYWKMDYFYYKLFEPLFVSRFDNVTSYYRFAFFAYITVYLCHYTHKSFAKSKSDRTSVERLKHSQACFNIFAVTVWTFHSQVLLIRRFRFSSQCASLSNIQAQLLRSKY